MSKDKKAGLIPYFFNEELGVFEYLMMVSSNAAYGGPDPMISKGGQDPGEDALTTAIREAREELGLKVENLAERPQLLTEKSYRNYKLTVYFAPVHSKHDFGEFCYETKETRWMTLADFIKFGREDHLIFVQSLDNLLTQ